MQSQERVNKLHVNEVPSRLIKMSNSINMWTNLKTVADEEDVYKVETPIHHLKTDYISWILY